MPKANQLLRFFNRNRNVGILVLRVFLGCRLIYGVIDNIISWDKMIEFSKFLETYQFPFPLASAILSVYIQFFASILILIGFKTRLASIILVLNFLVALFGVHIRAGDSIEGMTPALAMFFIALSLTFTGAEKLSVDHYLQYKKK